MRPGTRRGRGLALLLAGLAVTTTAVMVAGQGGDGSPAAGAATVSASVATPSPASVVGLGTQIAQAQALLVRRPDDWQVWAQLGLEYVQQAKITVDSTFYPRAETALATSLTLQPTGNYLALAGQGALAAARHDFTTALARTQAAAAIDPANAVIFGAMADALTQLGRYAEAETAVDTMLHLHPGTPAFARKSYALELRGDLVGARAAMEAALAAAGTPSDRAFAHYYLGELDFTAGDPGTALDQYRQGLEAAPTDVACLEGSAKAEAALGRTDDAVAHYATLVGRVPVPGYVLEFGDLLTSLGRTTEAQDQYSTFTAEVALFTANGVTADLEPALYYADHGDPAAAVRYGVGGLATRPFLEVQDAAGWALHRAGRDAEALPYLDAALATGVHSALFLFHRGMVESALHHRDEAGADLRAALALNPYFSPLQVPQARAELVRLAAGA